MKILKDLLTPSVFRIVAWCFIIAISLSSSLTWAQEPIIPVRVTDQNGRALAGVQVRAFYNPIPYNTIIQNGQTLAEEGITDGQGRFTFRFRDNLLKFMVLASHPDYATDGVKNIYAYPRRKKEVRIRLSAPVSIKGKVVDEKNNPLAAIPVQLWQLVEEKPKRWDSRWFGRGESKAFAYPPIYFCKTDKQGNFQFDHLPQGCRYKVKIDQEGYECTHHTLEPGKEQIIILKKQLKPAEWWRQWKKGSLTVCGKVEFADGSPAEHILVIFGKDNPDLRTWDWLAIAYTDAQGKYSLPNLPERLRGWGEIRIYSRRFSYQITQDKTGAVPQPRQVDIRVVPYPCKVTGRFLRRIIRKPIPEARVYLRKPGHAAEISWDISDGEGYFSCYCNPGHYEIFMSRPGPEGYARQSDTKSKSIDVDTATKEITFYY